MGNFFGEEVVENVEQQPAAEPGEDVNEPTAPPGPTPLPPFVEEPAQPGDRVFRLSERLDHAFLIEARGHLTLRGETGKFDCLAFEEVGIESSQDEYWFYSRGSYEEVVGDDEKVTLKLVFEQFREEHGYCWSTPNSPPRRVSDWTDWMWGKGVIEVEYSEDSNLRILPGRFSEKSGLVPEEEPIPEFFAVHFEKRV